MKEVNGERLFKQQTYPIMITFNPSYLMSFRKQKIFMEDLKELNKKY